MTLISHQVLYFHYRLKVYFFSSLMDFGKYWLHLTYKIRRIDIESMLILPRWAENKYGALLDVILMGQKSVLRTLFDITWWARNWRYVNVLVVISMSEKSTIYIILTSLCFRGFERQELVVVLVTHFDNLLVC